MRVSSDKALTLKCSVSLNNRLLRSGSGSQLDQLLLDLQTHWDNLEQGFGLSIGLREFAYICSKNANLSASDDRQTRLLRICFSAPAPDLPS
jgi:hypothetical protein